MSGIQEVRYVELLIYRGKFKVREKKFILSGLVGFGVFLFIMFILIFKIIKLYVYQEELINYEI